MSKSNPKIELLQVIRFVAACFIIIYHIGIFGERGYFGVEIFNILSGFLLIYSTETINKENKYLLKRLIRIVPLYWTLTLVAYVIICMKPSLSVMSEPNLIYLIKSLLFIPFVNGDGFNVPILAVGWTLNYEIIFYIIFYIAMKINYNKRAFVLIILKIIFIIINSLLHGSYLYIYYSNIYILEFCLGIISYYIIRCFEYDCDKWVRIALYIVSLALLVYLVCDFGGDSNIHRLFRLGIPTMILFINLVLVFKKYHFNTFIIKLGNMTYSIFLIEYFTTAIYRVLTINMQFGMKLMAMIPLFVITFVISYIFYQIIEIKFTKYLKEHLL